MADPVQLGPMQSARDDLERRTLSGICCDLARLIYLASTRDYNSGTYHHEGLAARFGPEQAREALQSTHRNIFRRLVALPLEELVTELEAYVNMSHEAPEGLIHAWRELEPYRVAVPMEMDSTMVRLFLSNIKLALEVLEFRQKQSQERQPASSLQPLLGR
ncbi:MAG: hypothetical protein WB607_00855 [Candidatus Acidiferrum sp.]|jgi:hypothetical protein